MFDNSVFRNHKNIRILAKYIRQKAKQPCTIMEVCGTHTMSIARWGIRELLPDTLRLISGPGCPVCVTDTATMAAALSLAAEPQIIFTCFGDMLRVPAGGKSLHELKSEGCDIRIVLSPLDALALAEVNPEREVVFFAVGFETTAPLTAAVVVSAAQRGIKNFSILSAHKTMPAALDVLLRGSTVDALLCPGHVAAVSGADAFAFIPENLHKPAAISGFEPLDIMLALAYLSQALNKGEANLYNCYPRIVKAAGNTTARALMERVFKPGVACWRGLGHIEGSGLDLRPQFSHFEAKKKFRMKTEDLADNSACCCGQVLRGEIAPSECPLFATTCTPDNPAGACMVSSEGNCAVTYKYGRRADK